MQIFIRGAAKLLAVNVENDDTIQDVYEYVAQESGCAMNDLLLSFHGTLLNNEQAIEELDLVSGATFDASVKVLGGKIHGNLSKVGKVKQATPKVPQQEKSKKKKTGRARRREQYSQRFANKVVLPNGMRAGPNSNYQPAASS